MINCLAKTELFVCAPLSDSTGRDDLNSDGSYTRTPMIGRLIKIVKKTKYFKVNK